MLLKFTPFGKSLFIQIQHRLPGCRRIYIICCHRISKMNTDWIRETQRGFLKKTVPLITKDRTPHPIQIYGNHCSFGFPGNQLKTPLQPLHASRSGNGTFRKNANDLPSFESLGSFGYRLSCILLRNRDHPGEPEEPLHPLRFGQTGKTNKPHPPRASRSNHYRICIRDMIRNQQHSARFRYLLRSGNF